MDGEVEAVLDALDEGADEGAGEVEEAVGNAVGATLAEGTGEGVEPLPHAATPTLARLAVTPSAATAGKRERRRARLWGIPHCVDFPTTGKRDDLIERKHAYRERRSHAPLDHPPRGGDRRRVHRWSPDWARHRPMSRPVACHTCECNVAWPMKAVMTYLKARTGRRSRPICLAEHRHGR